MTMHVSNKSHFYAFTTAYVEHAKFTKVNNGRELKKREKLHYHSPFTKIIRYDTFFSSQYFNVTDIEHDSPCGTGVN